jgi:two-component system response regulator AtoC
MRKFTILRNAESIVRELQAATARTRASEQLQPLVPDSVATGPNKTILEQVHKAKNEAETAAIIAALESTHWNRKKAAILLKIDYKALLYKMKKLDIGDRMATLSAAAGSTS